MPKNYMARDQFNNTYHDLGPHPRQALINRLGFKHVSKMYRDPDAISWALTGAPCLRSFRSSQLK
jgi:hypothetical protein